MATTSAATQKIFKLRLDGHFPLFYNRTNVRRMRGGSMKAMEQGSNMQQMIELLANATEEEAQYMLDLLIGLRDGASYPRKTADLRD